ncbi:MAG: alpha/beta fold hydrolase [Calditrichaeota bacterium]|nr:MAG: alpha/beta fold hydrolase [Calditrichota bacterium]
MKPETQKSTRHRIWRWLKYTLLAMFLLVLVFVLVVVPYGFSHLITHARTRPMDLRLTSTPANYQIPYRDVTFYAPARDADRAAIAEKPGASDHWVRISAWYLPRDSARALIVYAHGLFRSRREMLERAAFLWQHGYAGLLLDLRRHGSSGGKLSGMGYLERLDIEAAVHFARDSLKFHKPILAFGVSMGAAATLLAAAETPDIRGIIVDSSFLSFKNTIAHHLKLFFGLPTFPLGDLVMFFTRHRLGFKYEDFDMQRAVAKIHQRPMLFIAGGHDRRMPVEVEMTLFKSAASPVKFFVVIPEATHGAAFRTDREKYEQALLQFLNRYF